MKIAAVPAVKIINHIKIIRGLICNNRRPSVVDQRIGTLRITSGLKTNCSIGSVKVKIRPSSVRCDDDRLIPLIKSPLIN